MVPATSAFVATSAVFLVLLSSTAAGGTNLTDITPNATLTVSKENYLGANGPEGSHRLTDGLYGTIFFVIGYTNKFWIKLNFPTAQVVRGYTMTSAGDFADMDPRNWRLLGSNDDASYVLLDARNNEFFKTRRLTKMYTIGNTKAYKYYKLRITRNNGSGDFQLADFRVYK